MKKLSIVLVLLAVGIFTSQAQETEFEPGVYLQLQGGAAYDFGDASFLSLLSPAAQIAVGYRFVDCWSARLAVNGWQGKHTSETGNLYGYQFVQPNLDLVLDWSSGFFGWKADRPVSIYSFFGVGSAIGLENRKANDLAAAGEHFEYLWQPTKFFWNTRTGVGTDIRLNDRVALNLEFDAQFYPESFNSRQNPRVWSGPDYHFALLGGLKFNLGTRPRKATPAYVPVNRPPEKYEPATTPRKVIPEETAQDEPYEGPAIFQGADVDIFFDLNKSVIRTDQLSTMNRLVSYLRNNPEALVKLDGYADRGTGTTEINQELSEQRVAAVRQYLVSRGIAADRVSVEAHGDTVQPFSGEKNRVVTCKVR